MKWREQSLHLSISVEFGTYFELNEICSALVISVPWILTQANIFEYDGVLKSLE